MSPVVTLKGELRVSNDFRGQLCWCFSISGLSHPARKEVLEILGRWTVKNSPLTVQEKQDRFGDTCVVVISNPGGHPEDSASIPGDVVNKLLNILAGTGLKVVGTQQGQTSITFSKHQTNLFIWTLQ